MKDQTHERIHPLPFRLVSLTALLILLGFAVQAQGAKIDEAAKVNEAVKLAAPTSVQLQIRLAEVDRRFLRELVATQGITSSVLPLQVQLNRPGQMSGKLEPVVARVSTASAGQAAAPVNLLLGGPASLTELGAVAPARIAWRELAAPVTLAVLDGRQAKVLVGSEIPIPVINVNDEGQNIVTAQIKEFGLRLQFRPVVFDDAHLRLELEPKITSVEAGAGMRVGNLAIPGLRVRLTQTVLELRDGQSFALTGLFDAQELASFAKLPALVESPLFSELFKGQSSLRNETEFLVMISVKLGSPSQAEPLATQPQEATARPALSSRPVLPLAGISGHAVETKRDIWSVAPVVSQAKRAGDISVQVEAGGEKSERKGDKKENDAPRKEK